MFHWCLQNTCKRQENQIEIYGHFSFDPGLNFYFLFDLYWTRKKTIDIENLFYKRALIKVVGISQNQMSQLKKVLQGGMSEWGNDVALVSRI